MNFNIENLIFLQTNVSPAWPYQILVIVTGLHGFKYYILVENEVRVSANHSNYPLIVHAINWRILTSLCTPIMRLLSL